LEDILGSKTQSLGEQLTDHHLEDILQALKHSHYASNSPIIIWRIFCRTNSKQPWHCTNSLCIALDSLEEYTAVVFV
jgi:hypothetical protein